jgi:hypothetical protein
MYKVVMKYPDGSTEEDDEVFESASEAHEYGLDRVNDYATGWEILNREDDPVDGEDEADFEVIEV